MPNKPPICGTIFFAEKFISFSTVFLQCDNIYIKRNTESTACGKSAYAIIRGGGRVPL